MLLRALVMTILCLVNTMRESNLGLYMPQIYFVLEHYLALHRALLSGSSDDDRVVPRLTSVPHAHPSSDQVWRSKATTDFVQPGFKKIPNSPSLLFPGEFHWLLPECSTATTRRRLLRERCGGPSALPSAYVRPRVTSASIGRVRAATRSFVGGRTEEKARQLRTWMVETESFHDAMYHSTIAVAPTVSYRA
jgi:hypothetical protein